MKLALCFKSMNEWNCNYKTPDVAYFLCPLHERCFLSSLSIFSVNSFYYYWRKKWTTNFETRKVRCVNVSKHLKFIYKMTLNPIHVLYASFSYILGSDIPMWETDGLVEISPKLTNDWFYWSLTFPAIPTVSERFVLSKLKADPLTK